MQGLVPPISTGHLPHQQQGQERFMASSELLSQLRRKFETCGSPMDQGSDHLMTEAQDLASPSPKIGFVVDSGTPSSIHTVEAQAKEALARGIPPAQTVYATDTAQPAVPVVRVATAPVAKAPTSKASYPLQQQNKRYIPQQVTPLVSQPPSPTQPAAQFWPNCSEADFELGRVIGTGSFGRVRLAVHKASGAVCAVKTISKSACVKRGQVTHLRNERHLLAAVRHPNLIALLGSWQDEACVHLVLEYIPGGELFALMRDKGRMSEDTGRFYAAQMVLALEYLHMLGIAYRDLKPENCLLDAQGYLRLADFGFAKVVAGGRTFTLCGTPDYLAPEVILNKGHGVAADWWSLGAVIYELHCGFPPFYTYDEELRAPGGPPDRAMGTYKKILTGRYTIPPYFSIALSDLVTRLLQADMSYRLGNLANGALDIKTHPFFLGVDWARLGARMVRAPFKPSIASPDDTSCFDDYSKLAPLQHPFHLTPDQQRLFEGV